VAGGGTIVVHGGAGRDDPTTRAARDAGVLRAAEAGFAVLARGGSALDAVVAATVVLEDDPAFNAGLGSVLTEDGHVEMDASLMEGTTLAAGAVGAVRGVANPILLARAVLGEGREVLRVGPDAAAMAPAHGVRVVAPEALVSDAARARWRAAVPASGETVGAVARDAHGHVAAATSTGGVAGKRPGRLGDSAIIGAGTWADDATGAISATGPGELIIRLALAHRVAGDIATGAAPDAAARAALDALRGRLAADAGLVVVDARGRVAAQHTTPAMPAAWRHEGLAAAAPLRR
jgi:L-asparaginase / beta-aspartyl-peptidase